MQKQIIEGIIFSLFHERTGPMAVVWLPSDLSIQIRDIVSLKTINMLVGERGKVPESLAIVPFPTFNQKGLVKLMEIENRSHRGGYIDGTLTVLFNEVNDLIFYKYFNHFQEIIDQASQTFLLLDPTESTEKELRLELESFYQRLVELLNELYNAESLSLEEEEFPKVSRVEETKKAYRFKVVLIGDQEVGKTSIALRFTDNAFRRTYIPTIGVNILERREQYQPFIIEFIIWDIAGYIKFQKMRKHFYQGSDGMLLVFDLTAPQSFQNIKNWFQDITFYLDKKLKGFLVGNKCDLVDQVRVQKAEIETLAEELNLEYIETSALTGQNIDAAFSKLGHLLIAGNRSSD